MAQSHKDTLIEWLQEAHAFAKHGETMLSGRTDALEDEYPELAARMHEHVEETRAHQKELAELLADLGSDVSKTKDIGGKVSAVGHSWGTQMSGETPVQSVAASIAFEHFEIANYRALVTTAEAADEGQAKATLESLVADDVAMAKWLEDVLVDTTKHYLTTQHE